MAKKKSTTSSYKATWVEFTAFWGIIISGIVGLINFIINMLIKLKVITGVGSAVSGVLGIMSIISQIAFFISAFLAGYAYSRHLSKGWRTAFWVFVILALLGILGVNLLAFFG